MVRQYGSGLLTKPFSGNGRFHRWSPRRAGTLALLLMTLALALLTGPDPASANTAPVFADTTVSRSVAENTAPGQNVGAAVEATDADNDDLTYTLGGTDAASFTIVAATGQIQTKSGVTYDHERRTVYSVTVTATDTSNAAATATVRIRVTDEDEPPSTPAAPTVAAVPGTARSLSVSWTAPANTGPSGLLFDVRYRQGTSGDWTDGPQDEFLRSVAIHGLTAATSYQVQVRASNAEGDSGWSASGSGTTGPSTKDATLSALAVSPTDITGFTSYRTSYEVGVSSTIATATVTATKNHSGANLDYSGTDEDTVMAGHQVSLSAAQNAVTVTVTAEDGTTTRVYTVNVNRGVTTDYGWKASDDFDGLVAAGVDLPTDIWSDGETMWVAKVNSNKLYAYSMLDWTRDSAKDISLAAAENTYPVDIWSDKTTIWTLDFYTSGILAYKMSDGSRDSAKDIDSMGEGQFSFQQGIWSDGTTMWVVQSNPGAIYAYNMSDGTRDNAKHFSLHADNSDPRGIWSDRTTMWVADFSDDKIYAYRISDGTRDEAREFNTLDAAGNNNPLGIWSDGTAMWVADDLDGKVYSYNHPVLELSAAVDGTSLVITYNQGLDTSATVPNTAFTVKKTPAGSSNEDTVALTGTPTISGKEVTLTLASAVAATDTVTVSYTRPATGTNNKAADVDGNQAPAFTDLVASVGCPRSDDTDSCLDFPHSADTFGVLSTGQETTGRLDAGDHGDWLGLEGLQKGKTYRVTVDFKGTDAVGGFISVSRGGVTMVWDSNFDGTAIADFKVLGPCCTYVEITPDSDVRPSVPHVGKYSVTLTDITDIGYLVGNIKTQPATDTFRRVGKDLTTATTSNLYAQSFTTGAHSAGYTLDRITAFITMEQTGGDSDAVPGIAIHSSSSSLPGTKLCDLSLPVDYEPGIYFSGSPGLVDTIYAGGCSSQTLSASTTYWVVFSETSSSPRAYHVIESQSAAKTGGGATVDSASATGWTMGHGVATSSGSTWSSVSSSKPLALGIYGSQAAETAQDSPQNNPATGLPAISGTAPGGRDPHRVHVRHRGPRRADPAPPSPTSGSSTTRPSRARPLPPTRLRTRT